MIIDLPFILLTGYFLVFVSLMILMFLYNPNRPSAYI